MITLLMALFMVMFSISSVNTAKFGDLQRALSVAFAGELLPGGPDIRSQEQSADAARRPAPQSVIPSIVAQLDPEASAERARGEEDDFERLKRQIDAYAREQGLGRQIQTTVSRRGLVVRLLTDNVLFDSGRADLKDRARPVLDRIARLLRRDFSHPIQVEGHTDNLPIRSERFPSNWELSATRATSVVRFLLARDVAAPRIGAAGYAHRHPIATNATAAGRAKNRRVEIVLLRREQFEGGTTP